MTVITDNTVRFSSETVNGWRPFTNLSELAGLGHAVVVFNSETKAHLVLEQQSDEPNDWSIVVNRPRFAQDLSGFDFWKPYTGDLRPLPHDQIFHNPPTVVVVLVPTTTGLVMVRRAARDTYGRVALPGGFQEVHDITWQRAGCREVFEETGIVLDERYLRHLETKTVEDGKVNLLFSEYMTTVEPPAPREANNEILEVFVAEEPLETAFSTHTAQVEWFFTGLRIGF